MTRSLPQFSKRNVMVAVLAIAALIVLTLFAAPHSKVSSGSTYSHAPSGYGAWYEYMQKQGVSLQRWQRPYQKLPGYDQTPAKLITLVQIYSDWDFPSYDPDWVNKGNTVIILGVNAPTTAAPFSTWQTSDVGNIKIETRRRYSLVVKNPEPSQAPLEKTTKAAIKASRRQRLGDSYGAVVWEEAIGKGKVILVTTPYLAANAYQDNLPNFQFLAQLVRESGHPIWIDEYLHGYKDKAAIAEELQETEVTLLDYFLKTPLLPIGMQVGVILLVAIWAGNRRFGRTQDVTPPSVDNSTAYIQALAEVLQKAECHDFVTEWVSKDEQRQLQRRLGLGQDLLEPEVVVEAWQQQTGRSPAELQPLLRPPSQHHRIRDKDLLSWLGKLQTIRQNLPKY